MSPIRLFLARHGEVESNRHYRYVGTTDEELTDLGREQAQALADSLADLGVREVITSPLRRATATAELIAGAAGVPLRVDERLREQSFGEWEGMRRDEVQERSERDRSLLARWESDPASAPPGGESLLDVQRRVVELIEELDASVGGAADADLSAVALPSFVLVSHVGPIKAVFAAALEAPLPAVRRIFLDPGTLSVVDWGEPPLLRLANSHGHRGWRRARWMKPG
jgi:broad specificity phosphatase PhoE